MRPPMRPTEEEEFDPQAHVLDEITQWAKMGEADAMRERYGKPPRPPPEEELPMGEPMDGEPLPPDGGMEDAAGPEMLGSESGQPGDIPGVEKTEDGEPEELDEEALMRALAAMGG